MRKLAIVALILASLSFVIGGISRVIIAAPIVVESRVYAGFTVIALLFAIALLLLEQKK
ncbi:MAG: hypothetical protein AABY84_12815 [Candidatus Firestonebacteria bacterium]